MESTAVEVWNRRFEVDRLERLVERLWPALDDLVTACKNAEDWEGTSIGKAIEVAEKILNGKEAE
jgi:hypothetical protein